VWVKSWPVVIKVCETANFISIFRITWAAFNFHYGKRDLFLVLFTTLRLFKDIMTIRYAFLMIFATDIPHFKCTIHKQLIHLHTFDYFLRSEMFLKNPIQFTISLKMLVQSQGHYSFNEIGCFTNFNIYHSWWHSPFWEKKVIMIRKLSIFRSTYLLKRRVSFLLITTVYTSHVCCGTY
jgi:hypothetical protein